MRGQPEQVLQPEKVHQLDPARQPEKNQQPDHARAGFIVFSNRPKPKSWCIGPIGRPPPIIPVTIVGEAKVGKTSITRHFQNLKFVSKYSPTFGVERTKIVVPTPNDICDPKVVFRFLDTNNIILDHDLATNPKDQMDSIMASLSRFVLIVYDITDHSSFEAVRDWLRMIRGILMIGSVFILVGNKCDSEKKRQVHKTAGEVLALQNDMMFLETSAKDGDNLDHLLHYITDV